MAADDFGVCGRQDDAELVGRHQTWGLYLGLAVGIACAAAWLRSIRTGRGPQALFGASTADLQAVDGVGEHRARVIRDGLVRLAESAYTERLA